jgi:hypothetical protein
VQFIARPQNRNLKSLEEVTLDVNKGILDMVYRAQCTFRVIRSTIPNAEEIPELAQP